MIKREDAQEMRRLSTYCLEDIFITNQAQCNSPKFSRYIRRKNKKEKKMRW